MTIVSDIRKSVIDATPVLAAVGATDLAVEKVRHARARAAAARAELAPTALQSKAQARVTGVAEQAQHAPAVALNGSLVLASKAQESYEGLAQRGERLIKRIQNQKSTKELIAQAEATFALGKGAVTTVRKSANEIQRSAKATLTTGRKQTATAADAIAESVVDVVAEESAEATAAVKQSAARTRTAARRTATTTRKSAGASKAATKRATTGAKNTASATRKATSAAAKKVGD